MLKRLKKFLSLLTAILLIISASGLNVSAASFFEGELEYISTSDEEIEALFDERAALLAEIFRAQGEQVQIQNTTINALNDIDMQLIRKGVTFLSKNEVSALFPETKTNKELALSGMTMTEIQDDTITPLVDIPDSAINTWASYRSVYTSDGVTYNIQKLVAQPAMGSSPLAEANSRIVTFSKNWKAGVENVLTVLAGNYVGAITSGITEASVVVKLYDLLEAFITGVSQTTEVDIPHIVYSWSLVTTASFMYVRPSTETDDYQWLSLICTKTVTRVHYQSPTFNYINSNGSQVLAPDIIDGEKLIRNTPSGYNSDSLAVYAYNTLISAGQNCVGYIDITAPEAKRVEQITPCCPSFPIHCEY